MSIESLADYFLDVLLICPARHRSSIHHHIHSDVSSSSLRIDLQTYDDSQEGNVGTCSLLRQFSSRIPEDFVVVPCDFIPPPSLPLCHLLNKFRVDALSESLLATTCWHSSQPLEKGSFPEEWGPLPTTFPIVWDPSSSTLLHIETPDSIDRDADEIELKLPILSRSVMQLTFDFNLDPNGRYPYTKLSSSFQDSHVYVFSRSVLDLLHQKPHFSSLREEFLPWLCKIQCQHSKRLKYTRGSLFDPLLLVLVLIHPSELNMSEESTSQSLSLKHSSLLNSNSLEAGLRTSRPALPTAQDGLIKASLKIGVVIKNRGTEFATRINTLHKFYEVNRRVG